MGPGDSTQIAPVDPITGYSTGKDHWQRAAVTIIGIFFLGILFFAFVRLIGYWTSETAGAYGTDKPHVTSGYMEAKRKAHRPHKWKELLQSLNNQQLSLEHQHLERPVNKLFKFEPGSYIRTFDRYMFFEGTKAAFMWFSCSRSSEPAPLLTYAASGKNVCTFESLPNGSLSFSAYSKNGTKIGSVTSKFGNTRDGQPHHVGFMINEDSQIELYLDGTRLQTNTVGNTHFQAKTPSSRVLLVATKYDDASSELAFSKIESAIGNITLWAKPLTQPSISALSQPSDMINPMELQTHGLISWIPVWDTDKNNVLDKTEALTNIKMVGVQVTKPPLTAEQKKNFNCGSKSSMLPPPAVGTRA